MHTITAEGGNIPIVSTEHRPATARTGPIGVIMENLGNVAKALITHHTDLIKEKGDFKTVPNLSTTFMGLVSALLAGKAITMATSLPAPAGHPLNEAAASGMLGAGAAGPILDDPAKLLAGVADALRSLGFKVDIDSAANTATVVAPPKLNLPPGLGAFKAPVLGTASALRPAAELAQEKETLGEKTEKKLDPFEALKPPAPAAKVESKPDQPPQQPPQQEQKEAPKKDVVTEPKKDVVLKDVRTDVLEAPNQGITLPSTPSPEVKFSTPEQKAPAADAKQPEVKTENVTKENTQPAAEEKKA